jgi:hypothetical protein
MAERGGGKPTGGANRGREKLRDGRERSASSISESLKAARLR